MAGETTRRSFLKTVAAAAGAAPLFLPRAARAQAASDRLNIAFVGTGGMGGAHVNEMGDLGQACTCYCDVDSSRWGDIAKRFPDARAYQDYRKMLDDNHDKIDGVMVGTPDHHHYPATIMAMKYGLNVYTQKPLTQTVWEARQLTRAAAKFKVVTQMGNQGHGGEGWRIVYEWVRNGLIGDVIEVHTWTNRPIWPQGLERPQGEDPVPDNLDWDIWLGPAPKRPYKEGVYHPAKWRGWIDFGAGALGDMACHTMDGIFWALEPGYPIAIEPIVVNGITKECYPNSSIVKWEFGPKYWRPAFTAYWYEGGLKPRRPQNLEPDRELPFTGNLFIGTKASLMVAGDYGDDMTTIPESLLGQVGKLKQLLPRSVGHYREWVEAIKGENVTVSDFSYAAPMTETILLGNIAIIVGERIEYDGPGMRITNIPEANRLLSKAYGKGWDFGGA